MDIFLQNIDLIAVKKIDKIEKEKRLVTRIFLKVSLEKREVLRKIKNYDRGKKEKS